MKINMNQVPEQEQTAKKPGRKPAKAPKEKKMKKPAIQQETGKTEASEESGGNIYKENLNKYLAPVKSGEIFRKNKFWLILAGILFLVFLSTNSRMSNTKTQLTVKIKRVTADTDRLVEATDEVKERLEEKARIEALEMNEEEEELAKNSAVEQGVAVATLQNAYRTLDVSEDYESFAYNRDSLDICFGDNDKNARTPWYPSFGSIPGTWEFASKAAFKGDTAKVLWLCYADEDRSLLAYCTANYNAGTKLFTEVKWKLTSYAQANIQSDDGTLTTDTEQITSIQDALQSLLDSGELNPSNSAELDEDTIQDINDMSDAREAYKNMVANGDVEGEEYDSRYNVGLDNSNIIERSDNEDSEKKSEESEESEEEEDETEESKEFPEDVFDDDFGDESEYE